MKMSKKTQYGIRAMVHLAKNSSLEEVVSLREISKNQGIPFDFLEKILSALEKEKLVKAKKGPRGGYFLARSPDEIKVLEVVKTLEGEISPVSCTGCPYSRSCSPKGLWEEVESSLEAKLGETTLSDLIKK